MTLESFMFRKFTIEEMKGLQGIIQKHFFNYVDANGRVLNYTTKSVQDLTVDLLETTPGNISAFDSPDEVLLDLEKTHLKDIILAKTHSIDIAVKAVADLGNELGYFVYVCHKSANVHQATYRYYLIPESGWCLLYADQLKGDNDSFDKGEIVKWTQMVEWDAKVKKANEDVVTQMRLVRDYVDVSGGVKCDKQ